MAWLFTLLALLLGTSLTLAAFPFLFRSIGRAIGGQLRSKAWQRRTLLLQRAVTAEREAEGEDRQSQDEGDGNSAPSDTRTAPTLSSSTVSSASTIDEEWEKVNEDEKNETVRNDRVQRSDSVDRTFDGVIGFFHPFCNAGGGGERVLFAAILATQRRYPRALCVVYTGDHDASKAQILINVRNRFNIDLSPARICFLYLHTRDYVLPSKWPHFTLLGQSLGSLLLGWDAFSLLPPDLFIDTMGYSFTLALSKWLFPSVPTAAYVHYPTISTDMLDSLHGSVSSGQGLNAGLGKGFRGKVKQIYWELFARLYSWVGGSVDVVMTNSSWTQNHVSALWSTSRRKRGKEHDISVVYPPCAVEELQSKIDVDERSEKTRTRDILYIAQFRPEKMHQTIIEAFHTFMKSNTHDKAHPSQTEPRPNLILVGSVRDDQDEKRVYKLRLQAQDIKDSVQFVVNAKWPQILEYLKSSSVGVNGMWNEHFGIGVVEYQAAGLISVVNDSGGPKEDIVIDIDGAPTGFHASSPSEFAEGFAKALSLSPQDAFAMRQRARQSSWRFSEQVFRDAWTRHLEILVGLNAATGTPR